MQRKLVQQGKGALTISLPKKWIDANSLVNGDYINIKEEENALEISTQHKEISKKLELDISDLNVKTIQQILKNAYITGVTKLTLSFKNIEAEHTKMKYEKIEFNNNRIITKIKIIDLVKEVLQILIGFEIIDQEENKIVLKQISKFEEEDFQVTFRRIFYLLEGLNAFFIEKFDNYEKNLDLFKNKILDLRKFVYYELRLINQNIFKNNSNLIYSILKSIEDMTHSYEFMFLFASKQKKLETSTKKMFNSFGLILNSMHRAYYDFSLEKYYEFDLKLRELYHEHNITYKKARKEDLRIKQMITSCAMHATLIMDNTLAINLSSH